MDKARDMKCDSSKMNHAMNSIKRVSFNKLLWRNFYRNFLPYGYMNVYCKYIIAFKQEIATTNSRIKETIELTDIILYSKLTMHNKTFDKPSTFICKTVKNNVV